MMNKKEITMAAKSGLAKSLNKENEGDRFNNHSGYPIIHNLGTVVVYFESNGCAEMVATFIDEETYIKCLPTLELLAKENNCIITESIN